jgi:hypothetical protein
MVPTGSSESKLKCRFTGGGRCSESCLTFWSSVVRNRKLSLWYFGLWFYPPLKKHSTTPGALSVGRVSTCEGPIANQKVREVSSCSLDTLVTCFVPQEKYLRGAYCGFKLFVPGLQSHLEAQAPNSSQGVVKWTLKLVLLHSICDQHISVLTKLWHDITKSPHCPASSRTSLVSAASLRTVIYLISLF